MVKRLILLLAAAVGPCLPAGLRAGKDRSTTAVTKFLRRDPRTARRPNHACKQVVLMGDSAGGGLVSYAAAALSCTEVLQELAQASGEPLTEWTYPGEPPASGGSDDI